MKLSSINPHDQSVVGDLETSSVDDVKNAVLTAKKAFGSWSEKSLEERTNIVKNFTELLKRDKQKFAELTTKEMGKPIAQSLEDVDFEVIFLDWYVANVKKAYAPLKMSESTKEKEYWQVYEPWGVCAVISPWNFPLAMATSGLVPALLAGNTVVYKPSEHCPLSQKMVVDLLHEAGIPEDVLQLVIGAGEVGAALVDQDVNLVWFTGSTTTGRAIYNKCGERFIKMICELGGSTPGIVFDDANFDNAVETVFWARFLNTGQVCNSIKRLFVQDSAIEKFTELLKKRVEASKFGDPLLEDVELGPLVSTPQLEKLEVQVADAIGKGATTVTGGKRPSDKDLEQGNYYLPTIITNATDDMKIMHEEVFGPVLVVAPFDNEESAIKMANDTIYGLSAEVYTTDTTRADRVAAKLHAGAIGINTSEYFEPFLPFGGYKQSGMGREYGIEGMREFAQLKVIAKAT